jgi:predicted DNA-binding helix-hairpin-helix protein
MDLQSRLDLLGREAADEVSCPGEPAGEARRREAWIYPAVLPDGRVTRLWKTLLENRCAFACGYCAQGRGMDGPDAALEPSELARTFDLMHRAGLVDGLFLSSAIRGHPDRVMERMVVAVEQLRRVHGFRGYVHLKVLPGANPDLAVRAAAVADRLSINLEAPTAERLDAIAPEKAALARASRTLALLAELSARPDLRCHGQSTQLVVGAGAETDREILETAQQAYDRFGLDRVYYSGFHPVPGTPLAGHPAVQPRRTGRLYQADVLLRGYGFAASELAFGAGGDLALHTDPKAAWASAHPERFPVDLARAARSELLRVPGIGPRAVTTILERRRQGRPRSLDDLGLTGRQAARAIPYVLLDGRLPVPEPSRSAQLALL